MAGSAISISNPTGGSSNNTVVESAGEWFLTLNIVEYPPEDGFSFQMAANGIGSYPAIHGLSLLNIHVLLVSYKPMLATTVIIFVYVLP